MIEVRGLRRGYGRRVAIEEVELTAAAGRVLGLLGPNGAGKTTTLRVIVGALAPTAGSVRVDGVDLARAPREAKARIGWLPERPPLHDDDDVDRYLRHVAALHSLPDTRDAVRRVVARLGLGDVVGRRCGALSKGWRQRVGLAAALVHDPRAVVLDEPSSGLDPAQRVELRGLVRALADEGRAVVLSSHVLAEIEPVCDDVVVLHRGRVVLAGAVASLAEAGALRLRVGRPGGLADALRAVPGVEAVEGDGERLRVRAGADARPAIARVAAEHDLLELVPESRLEAAFVRATGGVA